ncbi:hypothetical protein [Lacinutrix sp.]|uniref:hypothetical protein n=1 Tax=Lacinutrix sp. TaxID=1937692 RepID=UPI0025BE9331|nr:hypothetical protein [Lacinutrix sp.]
MKKVLLLAVAILGFSFISTAQDIADNAIGLRIGDNDGFGAEISYQRALGDNNRLEVDLGIRSGSNFSGFKATSLYQWVWELEDSFNWYAGAGGGLGNYSFDLPASIEEESETFLFVAGNVGVEYNFDIPFILSLDVRPEIGFGDFRNDLDFDLALGIRYKF